MYAHQPYPAKVDTKNLIRKTRRAEKSTHKTRDQKLYTNTVASILESPPSLDYLIGHRFRAQSSYIKVEIYHETQRLDFKQFQRLKNLNKIGKIRKNFENQKIQTIPKHFEI